MAINIVTITTLNRIRLYGGQPSTSEVTLYTVPASTDVKVAEVVITNTSSVSATVSLSAVPSGGSASASNRLVSNLSVAAGEVVVMDMSVYMTTGDFLSAIQSSSGAITLTICGETYA